MKCVRYSCGTEAKIGDIVDLDGTPATIEAVIASPKDMATWGLGERGLMFKTKNMGLMFHAESSDCWPENVFIRRMT